MGLDQALPVQYAKWLWQTVHLNLGTSITQQRPVLTLVWQAFLNTLLLATAAAVIAAVVGLVLGITAALRQSHPADRGFYGSGLPRHVHPQLLAGVGHDRRFFCRSSPVALGRGDERNRRRGPVDVLKHLALPAIAVAAAPAGIIARSVRASLLDIMRLDFVVALRASGLREVAIVRGHVVRNALPAIVTVMGLQMGYLLAGVAFVEVVFGWPGIGSLLFVSISERDYPVLLGIVLVVSVAFVVLNLLVDLLHAALDPRVRVERDRTSRPVMVSLSPVERDAHLDWGEFTARRSVVDRFRHDRLALAASVLLLALIMICALAPVTAPYSPYKINPANLFAPPGSPGHLLGTDNEGRDMLSRLIWGGRVSLITGIVPVVIGLVVGGSIGLLAGFKGGATRTTIMRAMDVFLAFPAVLLAIAIAMTLGPGAATSSSHYPWCSSRRSHGSPTAPAPRRVVRSIWRRPRHRALSSRTIIVVQLWKNAASPPLAYCFSIVGPIIVFAAGLNYLGLGVQPPAPEWGSMLFGMQSSLLLAPTQAIIPGAPIAIVALLFDLIGNAVRDVLDPRLV